MVTASRVKKNSGVVGVWLTTNHPKGDIHVYGQNGVVVIGQNKDYNDKIAFSDLALMFKDGEEIQLQYADEAGNAKHVSVLEKLVRSKILALLTALKEELVDQI